MTPDTAATCQRALGFLELGMTEDAWNEMSELPAAHDEHSPVRQLRVEILGRMGRWGDAAALCLPMLEKEPGEIFWWIQGAYAQRRAHSIEAADAILRGALAHHPPEGIVLYNLACYACVQGRMEEAKDFLNRTIHTDPEHIIAMALKDEDLIPLRPWVIQREAELRASSFEYLPPKP